MPVVITSACKGCQICLRICPVEAIRGERRQLHVVDPARCVDCSACGRICPFGAVKNARGQVIPHQKRPTWRTPRFEYSACVGCVQCVFACPAGVIRLKGSLPILADAAGCIACDFCARSCPTGAIQMENNDKIPLPKMPPVR